MAGCPNWSNFADAALRHFVEQGKFSHGQLAQLSHQHPRVKLSIALGLAKKHNLPIDFDKILYPRGVATSPKGRRLYDALSKLGKTFVTTNYDRWLDTTIESPSVSVKDEAPLEQPSIPGRRTALYNVDDFVPARLNQPDTVFHLHGSMRDPRSMVMTTPHYVRHYANDRMVDGGKENNVLSFLSYLFAEKSVLFVGYGLEELEILEYVIGKARLIEESGAREMKHFLLQGFFSHESELARSLDEYYRECGIELIPFLRDEKDWEQLIDVLEHFGRLAPVGPPLPVQKLKEMEALLD